MTPRQEHEQAIEQQYQRLDEARRELNRQRRELDRAMPYDHQKDERSRRLEPAREVFRQRQVLVDEDGGKYWNWKAPAQRVR